MQGKFASRFFLHASLIALVTVGGIAGASAIDRKPFPGHSVSDARPGYGSSSSGYGAERQYYGAENIGRRSAAPRYSDSPRYDGSFVDFEDERSEFNEPGIDGYVTPFGVEDASSGIFPGFDEGFGGSIVDLDDQVAGFGYSYRARSNVLNVKEERLDRQPIAASGIAVTYVGASKIIRLASTGNTVKRPAAAETGRAGLAPWSEAWSRYCSRAHANFDPKLGTFTDADGAARFCTGE